MQELRFISNYGIKWASTGNNSEMLQYHLNLLSEQKFVPLSIGKKIFDNFGSGEQKNLVTPEMQDKAICYVIVLGKTLPLLLSNDVQF